MVGACMALRPDDYEIGTHRSHGHPIAKGANLNPLMAELLGRATGVNHGKGGSMHLADFSVGSLGESSIVGSGLPVAAGAALGAKMLGNKRVCICFFGDGASNQGTFHEALNMAAIWKLPVIYLCENKRLCRNHTRQLFGFGRGYRRPRPWLWYSGRGGGWSGPDCRLRGSKPSRRTCQSRFGTYPDRG